MAGVSSATWFPGQMARTRRLIKDNLPLVGLVIEVADARAPRATRYPGLTRLVPGRPILTVLGKADLADPVETSKWVRYLDAGGVAGAGGAAAFASTREDPKGVRDLLSLAARLGRTSSSRPVARAMVVGFPNVGKSTLINRLVGRASAATGDRPGITRGKQWLRAGEGLELLDLPGILVPGHIPPRVVLILALLGLLPALAYDAVTVAEYALGILARAGKLPEGIPALPDGGSGSRDGSGPAGAGAGTGAAWARDALSAFALARKHLRRGGEPDLERAAVSLVGGFREGRFGRLTLESPPESPPGFAPREGAPARGGGAD